MTFQIPDRKVVLVPEVGALVRIKSLAQPVPHAVKPYIGMVGYVSGRAARTEKSVGALEGSITVHVDGDVMTLMCNPLGAISKNNWRCL